MGFDAQRFLGTPMDRPEQDFPVPALRGWFAEGEDPVWPIRGLTANDLVRIRNAGAYQNREKALASALMTGDVAAISAATKNALGRGDDVEPDTASRIETICLGSRFPDLSDEQIRSMAVKLEHDYPFAFIAISNAITALSGQDPDPKKKPTSSSPTPASEVH
jgi:hypothetical protein